MSLEQAFQATSAIEDNDTTKLDPTLIPEQVSLEDVITLLDEHSKQDTGNALRTALAVLEARPDLISGDEARENVKGTLTRVATLMNPRLQVTEENDKTHYDEISRTASTAIEMIHLISSQNGIELPPSVAIALITYTNQNDRWTSPELAESAQELLHSHLEYKSSKLQGFILEDVLNAFIRPLFSKSRPATVTASGRKAEFVQPSRYGNLNADAEANKPWKYQHRYAITVFSWAVDHVDEETLRKNWHQFTPVLLTLLDETDTLLKLQSLSIFRTFWAKCPAEIMQQTGLAQVFEDAIFPAVLYLPSLTPESESVQVLNATYPALFDMAGVDPDFRTSKPQSGVKFADKQRKLVHKIVREGILVGFHHSGEYIRIVEVLCRTLQCVTNGMGILAVKHLKDTIPMLSTILSDPFAPAHPPSLLAALDALSALQSTCWPRLPGYANDIIKMLMLCWLSMEDDEEEGNESSGKGTTSKAGDGHLSGEMSSDKATILEKLRHNARMLDAILLAQQAEGEEEEVVEGKEQGGSGGAPTISIPASAAEQQEDPKSSDGGSGATLAEKVRPLVGQHASLAKLFFP